MRFIRTALVALIASLSLGAAALAQGKPVKVGIIFSFTGASANAPILLDTGIAAYQKLHGDSAGGHKIVLIRRDDTGVAPDVARRLAQELVVQEHVDFLAGLIFTPNAIAAGNVSTQTKTPLLIVNAATSGILAKNPYAFRFGITTAQITTPLGTYAAKTGGKTAFAITQDYGPGIDAATSFEKAFTDAGGTIAGEVRMPISSNDYTAFIQRAKDSKADVIYAFVNGVAAPSFLHAYRTAGVDKNVRFFTTGDIADDARLKIEGDEALGIISSSNYYVDLENRTNRAFVAAYHAAGPNAGNPDFVAVSAYDMMNAIYKTVGSMKDRDLDKTVDLLSHLKFESPRGPFEIDPQTRDAVQNIYILRTVKRDGVIQNVPIAAIPMVRDPNEK